MSWPSVRDTLVTIIEGTTPTMARYGAPARLKHHPQAEAKKLPDTRGFWFELVRMAMKGHITSHLPQWLRYELDLVTFYKSTNRPTDLFEIIAADHTAVTTRLADPSRWNQPTSTIESLFLGEELVAETELEPILNGDGDTVGLLARLRMVAEFRD